VLKGYPAAEAAPAVLAARAEALSAWARLYRAVSRRIWPRRAWRGFGGEGFGGPGALA